MSESLLVPVSLYGSCWCLVALVFERYPLAEKLGRDRARLCLACCLGGWCVCFVYIVDCFHCISFIMRFRVYQQRGVKSRMKGETPNGSFVVVDYLSKCVGIL